MRAGRGRLAAGAVLVAVVAAVSAALAATRGGGDPAVVVADERGHELASVPLPASGEFALRYRHSVYRAEVTETFAATGDGFRLVAVASPSEAVLDYYELEGRRRLELAATPRLVSLPWSPPRSAAAPWRPAGGGCRCSPRAATRPGWSSASAPEAGA